jgi:hypothetical protein
MVMLPMIGKPHEVHISADDLIAIARSRRFDYITDLLHFVAQYNSMIYGVEAYGRRRDALMAEITPDTMVGLIGRVAIPDTLMARLRPQVAVVRDLADQTRIEVKELYDASSKIVDAFGPIVKKYFDDPSFPVPARISGADPRAPKAS